MFAAQNGRLISDPCSSIHHVPLLEASKRKITQSSDAQQVFTGLKESRRRSRQLPARRDVKAFLGNGGLSPDGPFMLVVPVRLISPGSRKKY
jgi:hypothetical protein